MSVTIRRIFAILLLKTCLDTENILAPSLFQLYFSGLMLIVLLPVSLLYILLSRQLSLSASLGISIATAISDHSSHSCKYYSIFIPSEKRIAS